ncbi:nuclear transport factor 2 family protein [Streptomyces sp. NPDC001027]|uniref:nuclear transport factor 2 family protein n=1 Tax=Streptomyces sp. NPDC001027 TaxID=3154771 RepID=UPI0033274D9A
MTETNLTQDASGGELGSSSRRSPIRSGEWQGDDLRNFLDAFNKHDIDRIMEFFADDCVLETPRGPETWGTRYEGQAAVREILSYRFGWLPDMHYGRDEHWAMGRLGVSRWVLTGTSVDGERIEVQGCDLMQLDDAGFICHKDSYWKIIQA